MNKKLNLVEVTRILNETKNAGIWVHLFFIVGFPGETEADWKETLTFLRKNRNLIDSAHVQPFRLQFGSYIFAHPKEFKVNIRRPLDKSELAFKVSKDFTQTIQLALKFNKRITTVQKKKNKKEVNSQELNPIKEMPWPKVFITDYLNKMQKIPDSIFFIYDYSTKDSNFYKNFLRYRDTLYQIAALGIPFYPCMEKLFK